MVTPPIWKLSEPDDLRDFFQSCVVSPYNRNWGREQLHLFKLTLCSDTQKCCLTSDTVSFITVYAMMTSLITQNFHVEKREQMDSCSLFFLQADDHRLCNLPIILVVRKSLSCQSFWYWDLCPINSLRWSSPASHSALISVVQTLLETAKFPYSLLWVNMR